MSQDHPKLQAHPGALQAMRTACKATPSIRWAAYQNLALDSALAGHIQFLAISPENTYKHPPGRYPADTQSGMDWCYLFIGWVDLSTGEIKEEKHEEQEGTDQADRG